MPQWDAVPRVAGSNLNPILRSESTSTLRFTSAAMNFELSPMAMSLWGGAMSVKRAYRKESAPSKGFRGIPH